MSLPSPYTSPDLLVLFEISLFGDEYFHLATAELAQSVPSERADMTKLSLKCKQLMSCFLTEGAPGRLVEYSLRETGHPALGTCFSTDLPK